MGLFGNNKEKEEKQVERFQFKCPYCEAVIKQCVDSDLDGYKERDENPNVGVVDKLIGYDVYAIACKKCKKIITAYGVV